MSNEFINPFSADTAIQLTNINELWQFENIVARAIDPKMTDLETKSWQARPHIKDLVRPAKFNGSIADIELMPLAESYSRLQSSREEGWQIRGRLAGTASGEDAAYRAERCLGFYFTADALSTGRGVIGEIQAGLWYLPVRRSFSTETAEPEKPRSKCSYSNGGRSIVRVVTKPRLESENSLRLQADAPRLTLHALKSAIRKR